MLRFGSEESFTALHPLNVLFAVIMQKAIESAAALSARLKFEVDEMLHGRTTELEQVMKLAYQHNKWFTVPDQVQAVSAIAAMLESRKLSQWLSAYPLPVAFSKTVGIIMAGNLPAVGFHDLLCVLLAGHKAMMKCSSDDNILMQWLAKQLAADLNASGRIVFTDRLKNMDAVIATGSDNSARYFEFYFSKIPKIIRKNRNSVAVLAGNESDEDLANLGADIFSYFGLGCRNVSKLYVPAGYDFNILFKAFQPWSHLMDHNKYMNNYDYHRAVYLMNREPFLTNNFVILKESEQTASPVSVVHYHFYENEKALRYHLEEIKDKLQCIVSSSKGDIPFGQTQKPEPWDYADGVDTIQFLAEIGK